MSNKKMILLITALVVVAALVVGVYFATRPETAQGAKTITLEVVHADGSEKEFTIHTDAEYLGEALVAEGLVSGEESEYGLLIDTVDGEKAVWEENNAYWALYIGDEAAVTGADMTPVNDGDTFKLAYTLG